MTVVFGFSILIRQAKPVPSKKNVINFCEEGKLWKAFGKRLSIIWASKKAFKNVDSPGHDEGIVLSSIYVQRGR